MKGDKHVTNTKQTAANRPTTNDHTPATAQTPKSKHIVGASQRRAEIVIATLFLVTAAASIPATFVLDPILNAPAYLSSGKDSRQMGQSNLIDESSSAGKEQLMCQRLSQPNA